MVDDFTTLVDKNDVDYSPSPSETKATELPIDQFIPSHTNSTSIRKFENNRSITYIQENNRKKL